jgi:6-phospho-beta-glucosidase
MFMALRSIAVLRDVIDDLDDVAPNAEIFNYTNPVNVVAQAVSDNTDRPIVSMCEGLITFPRTVLRAARLEESRAEVTMAGINHNCWSTRHLYDGQDLMPLLDAAWAERRNDPTLTTIERRHLHIATRMRSVPSDYFHHYYYKDEVLRELDPSRSRGGIHELELAIDVMAARFNDTGARLPVNVPNAGGALPGFDEDTVVEVWANVDADGYHIEPQLPLPHAVRGLTQQLAEHQRLAAIAAWDGNVEDGIRALAAHPLVPSLTVAEDLYVEMARAHSAHLPARLVP